MQANNQIKNICAYYGFFGFNIMVMLMSCLVLFLGSIFFYKAKAYTNIGLFFLVFGVIYMV